MYRVALTAGLAIGFVRLQPRLIVHLIRFCRPGDDIVVCRRPRRKSKASAWGAIRGAAQGRSVAKLDDKAPIRDL